MWRQRGNREKYEIDPRIVWCYSATPKAKGKRQEAKVEYNSVGALSVGELNSPRVAPFAACINVKHFNA
ncbi:MAG: hypothetical protein F6K52_18720 [Moorea sp. SIO3H5]|nr:hypothetical protein [Moorena sp. SIO3H5]